MVRHNRVTSLAISPGGKYLISGSRDKTLRVWDLESSFEFLYLLEGHTHYVTSVKFSNSGDYVASASWDETVRLWSFPTGELQAILKGNKTDFLTSVAFSSDDIYIAAGSYSGKVSIWNRLTSVLEKTLSHFSDHPASSVAFSPTGSGIACSWNWLIIASDHILKEPNILIHAGYSDIVTSIAYSPNGRYIASGSRDYTIYLSDSKTGKRLLGPFYGHTYCVTSVSFSSDSKYLVSGGQDNMVRMWDIETAMSTSPESRKFLHDYPAGTFIFRKDGWVLTTDNKLFMWIPPSKMHILYTPQTYQIFGDEKITIDLSDFAHGDSWTSING